MKKLMSLVKSRAFLLIIVKLLACLLLLLLVSQCVEAAEYRVTEQELTQLETNLDKLETLNRQSQRELKTLKEELQVSQENLNRAKQESTELSSQLTTLAETSKTQESLLATANESLEKYAKEQKKKMNRIKWQRNIACVLFIGIAAIACANA